MITRWEISSCARNKGIRSSSKNGQIVEKEDMIMRWEISSCARSKGIRSSSILRREACSCSARSPAVHATKGS